jgi:hypothetical protein
MDEDRILERCLVRIDAVPRLIGRCAILPLRIFLQYRNLPTIMLKRLLCLAFFLLTANGAWASLRRRRTPTTGLDN